MERLTEEEKPIRVVDRRMFTADGQLRPGFEPEEAPEPPKTAPSPPKPGPSPGAGSPEPGPATSRDFLAFLTFLASNVYAALGIDPRTGERLHRSEPAAARQMIDWLPLLEQKTRGNLSVEESQLLADLLRDLRFAYVEATRPPGREPPR
jgi:hypothetical protein